MCLYCQEATVCRVLPRLALLNYCILLLERLYIIYVYLYFIIYILVTNSIPHTLGITRMTSKRKGPSAYTGIVCICCLYIGHYWTWLDFVFVSLFIMYICVCFFCLHLHQWHLAPDMISHYVLYWCLQHFNGEGRWRAQYVCPLFTQRTLRLTSSARRYVSRWGLALWSHGKNVKVLGSWSFGFAALAK